MALAGMIKLDVDALECDFAETYLDPALDEILVAFEQAYPPKIAAQDLT